MSWSAAVTQLDCVSGLHLSVNSIFIRSVNRRHRARAEHTRHAWLNASPGSCFSLWNETALPLWQWWLLLIDLWKCISKGQHGKPLRSAVWFSTLEFGANEWNNKQMDDKTFQIIQSAGFFRQLSFTWECISPTIVTFRPYIWKQVFYSVKICCCSYSADDNTLKQGEKERGETFIFT